MSADSFTQLLEGWFETPFKDLPETVQRQLGRAFIPARWDKLSPTERREVALRLDSRETTHAPDPDQYLPYPKAARSLLQRLGATPEEMAAWVFMGPQQGGLAAYLNVDELGPAPRFYYGSIAGEQFDYMAPLMACWFRKDDLANFQPDDRFITGQALVDRWSEYQGMDAEAFIRAKITESRLLPMHPIMGETQWTEDASFPPKETALFALAHVETVEAEDLSEEANPKAPGHLNHDPDLQARANQIAAERMAVVNRRVTRDEVAKVLALELGMEPATVMRRIRKQWS